MGGRITVESVAGCSWNRWPDGRGIRIPACFELNMAPGPNNLLSISNATRYGYRASCMAGVGRLLAFAIMIALASAGLAVVLKTSELVFYGFKVVGAAYLLYLAYQLWGAAPEAEFESENVRGELWGLARQEFLVAAGNPNDGQYKLR
jgi:threonine/homoserine/homoserine lactone efflux protein